MTGAGVRAACRGGRAAHTPAAPSSSPRNLQPLPPLGSGRAAGGAASAATQRPRAGTTPSLTPAPRRLMTAAVNSSALASFTA